MDKNDIFNDKIRRSECMVHRKPKAQRGIHEKYGLWIVSCGSHEAPPDGYHRTPMRYFEYFSISHLRAGKGRLWLPGRGECDILPGQCVVIAPQQVNRYGGADGEPYIEDSVCFTGPIADMLWRSGILATGVYEFGEARRLLPVQKLALDPSDNAQINANIALQKLLVDLYNENLRRANRSEAHSDSLDKLLDELRGKVDRWWTVEEMSEFCDVGADHFRRLFKKRTGMLPKAYIEKLKLNKAAELLVNTQFSVGEVAEALSYADQYHFSRRFKAVMGFPPARYRRIFGALGSGRSDSK